MFSKLIRNKFEKLVKKKREKQVHLSSPVDERE
jgi:hypothetical protein